MNKPIKKIIFQPMQGIWQDDASDSGTLAETLQRLGIIIDDRTQFARLYDYEKGIQINVHIGARNTYIEIWQLQ